MSTTITLNDPADTIAALPIITNYVVHDAIVILFLAPTDGDHADRTAIASLTFPLPSPVGDPVAVCGLSPARIGSVLIIAVSDQLDGHVAARSAATAAVLADAGITVARRLHTTGIAAHGRWTDLDSGDSGPTYPYTLSIRAGQAGSPIAANAAALVAEFAETAAAPLAPCDDSPETLIEVVEEYAAVLAAGRITDPRLITRLGMFLEAHPDRFAQTIIALSLDHPGPAAALWTAAAGRLRHSARIMALTLAGIHHYLGHDLARARAALEVAKDEADDRNQPLPRLTAVFILAFTARVLPAELTSYVLGLAAGDDDTSD